MALWPFGRRKRKARNDEKGGLDDEDLGITTQAVGPAASKSLHEGRESKASSIKPPSTRKVSKSREAEKAALQAPPIPEIPRSHSPGAAQVNEKGFESDKAHPRPSRLPLSEIKNPKEAPPVPSFAKDDRSASQTSIQPENFTAVAALPTLRSSKSALNNDVSRKKSSKRKSNARAREQEIRSMTLPIPIPKRPQSFTSGLLARDSQTAVGGLNRKLTRPRSEVSLPYAESLQSEGSGEMQHNFRVSAFDALSPRPTIRFSESPRRLGGTSHSRMSTRKEKGAAIPEEDLGPKARINDLADDMTSTGLRELMDRDRRRRDRKKRQDQKRLEEKLQRRAEKQKVDASGAEDQSGDVHMGDAPPMGLGIGESSKAAKPSSTSRIADRPALTSTGSWLDDASKHASEEHVVTPPEYTIPLEDPFHEQSHLDLGTDDEKEEPVVETAQAVRLSTASMSPPASPAMHQHPRGPSNLSVVTSASPTSLGDIPEPESDRLYPVKPRRDSATNTRVGSGWTSFFKRSGARANLEPSDKGRSTPSEFSNTSRESFAARQNRVPPPPPIQRSFKPKNGTPQRTRSKFREDLPELPISPPTSRFQSPDRPESPASPASPYIDHSSKIRELNEQARSITPIGDVHPAFRDEVVGQRSETPDRPSLLSQSLASVDSEGSWLSGRPQKRSSIPIDAVREGSVSMAEQLQELDAGEPYFSRRAPSPAKAQGRGALSSALRPVSALPPEDDDDLLRQDTTPISPLEESPKYSTVHGGKPRLIQRSPALKSREGLLDEFTAGEGELPSEPSPDTPTESPAMQQLGMVHRATSVDYGKGHTRRVSAGSARLLDIPARSSTEQKRMSGLSNRSSLTGIPVSSMEEGSLAQGESSKSMSTETD